MDQKNSVGIRKIAYTKLRKLEVYSFFKEVVDVIGQYDTKAMQIGDLCDVLISLQPKAQLLRLTDHDLGPHPLTSEVDRLHETRLRFAAIITNHIRTLEKADFEDNRHMIKMVKPLIYRYLTYLRQQNRDTIESRLNGFFYELRHQPEVKDALYELGFKTYLNELEAAKDEYIVTLMKRTSQKSKPKGSTIPVQRELQYIMNLLFEQVNYYQHIYKDIDYSRLLTELNIVIATYTKLIKTRDTKRKNNKLKAKEVEQSKVKLELGTPNNDKELPTALSLPDLNSKPNGKPSSTPSKGNAKYESLHELKDNLKKPDEGKPDGDEEEKK